MFEFALIHYRKIFAPRLFDFTGIYSNPSRYFQSGGTRTQQFARVYIPLRKRVDGKYPGATRARAPRIRRRLLCRGCGKPCYLE